MRVNKRAQEGGSAATVIGIIALLFVFYILFIPPEERAKLLNDNTDTGTSTTETTANHTLLLANIGKLDYLAQDSYDHTMPNVYLTESKNAQVLTTFSPFILERNWFTDKTKDLVFNIADPDKTDNVLLVFEAPVRNGILTVTLNDQVIYEAPLDSQTPPPIPLRRAQLSTQNTLKLELSGVGAAFWKTNTAQFTNVQIIGDVTDESFQTSTTAFTLVDEEARNLKTASLLFYPICEADKIGTMDVYVNQEHVFGAKPDCESANKIELDTSLLHAGSNTLSMRSSVGTMRVEQVHINTQLQQSRSYVDYFLLNDTDINNINDNGYHVRLYIDFVDDGKEKVGAINVNGRLSAFDQTDASYSKDITDYVKEGNNYLEVRPDSILNIVTLEVRLE